MGLSRAFGCFQDPEARALKKQKKAGKRNHDEETRPIRVIAATARGDQAEIEVRSLPDQSPLPANSTMRNFKPPPLEPGSDEPEPWSVGAVIRHTSLLQARLDEAAYERKHTDEKMDGLASKARCQATVEEDVEMPVVETKPKVIAEKKEDRETSTEKVTATPNNEKHWGWKWGRKRSSCHHDVWYTNNKKGTGNGPQSYRGRGSAQEIHGREQRTRG